MRLTFEH